MIAAASNSLDYSRPIAIKEGIYWVGFRDVQSGLHCNPYLIVEGEEGVVIDGGSRPDFPSVMMKILSTGIDPSKITTLIYQHYDPDLCGSISNFEDIIERSDLRIISAKYNHMFIRHYAATADLFSLEDYHQCFRFATGRELRFTPTPYAHSEGSFVTFDSRSGVLFTSDLFGSFGKQWELFLKLESECHDCEEFTKCPAGRGYCPVLDLLKFHQHIIPSEKILKYTLEQLAEIPFSMIAPQHGSVIREPKDVETVWKALATLKGVGIDGLIGDRTDFKLRRVTADR